MVIEGQDATPTEGSAVSEGDTSLNSLAFPKLPSLVPALIQRFVGNSIEVEYKGNKVGRGKLEQVLTHGDDLTLDFGTWLLAWKEVESLALSSKVD